MSEDELSHMSIIPTEVLTHIFSFTQPIALVKCRQVCWRWKVVVDSLLRHDQLWRQYCEQDFNEIYKVAYYKSKSGLRWFDVYRTLSLWPRFTQAVETTDEFASASNYSEEVRDFQILRDGIIGVHCRGAITYYDLNTMEAFKSGNFSGNYLRYMENESTILVLRTNLHLLVIRKFLRSIKSKASVTFQSVKTFILLKHEIYFVTLDDAVYVCNLKEEELECVELAQMNTGIMCIGYSKQLNILTFQRDIYSLNGNEKKFECTIGPSTNLLHILRKYNLLEHLDWRVYFQWMYVLNQSIPQGPLRDIIIIKTYGDAVFVGSNWGVFRIYYAPYVDGEFDIFRSEPVKQYNFMERCDCPVLSMCPIIQIDIIEGRDCHLVLIAMPKKIAIITYSHDFYKYKLVSPYTDSDIQILKISD